MSKLSQLANMGQSVWYDNISRALIRSGQLKALLDAGVVGVTSNPSIFEKAIAGTADYDQAIQPLAAAGNSVQDIYESLALADIEHAADLLRPIYDRSNGLDGYVSLEVNPELAHETEKSIEEGRRLFGRLNRPNVMIKVPATPAGIPAITALIGAGINVNVTLIFSLASYRMVAEAYIAGLEKLAAAGGDLGKVASVASFFVSRVDAAVDKALAAIGNQDLQGKIAIANAKVAYQQFSQIFSGPRWDALAARGARVQRPLWASTSTKNPDYPDTLYVDELIGADTVNTVPPATLDAFRDHGTAAPVLGQGADEAAAQLARLSELGVDMDAITQKLQDDGVASFANSFVSLLASVAQKRDRLLAAAAPQGTLGGYQAAVDQAMASMGQDNIMQRIWDRDHTVWRPEPAEIANRLGWLDMPEAMAGTVDRLDALVQTLQTEGYTHALLLGMGGSSLAPEVFYRTYGASETGLILEVLDSTDPGRVLEFGGKLDLAKTLFIVSTKSGGTVETLSFFQYFYNKTADALGVDAAGDHFIAITDPGSKLEKIAAQYRFRETFLNDPNIGGRYSVLSFFGLVPAALVGVDVRRLLQRAKVAAANSQLGAAPGGERNHSAWVGAVMGELAKAGRDKVTIVASAAVESFGDWVEQLIAESTGKEGKGILPVVGEPLGAPAVYGDDRLFVHLCFTGDESQDQALAALADTGHPVVKIVLNDLYDLGGQFFLWEMATAVAGHLINIQPFDQPNVESAKVLARQMVAAYMEKGTLPAGETTEATPQKLAAFLSQGSAGDYIALHAYVPPTAETDQALAALRVQLRDKYKLATTVGYGPRFLHSTGQLHKGDRGNGLFIQITSDPVIDADIPDQAGQPASTMSFGVLEMSQALGDGKALLDGGRHFIRFHAGTDVVGTIKRLTAG